MVWLDPNTNTIPYHSEPYLYLTEHETALLDPPKIEIETATEKPKVHYPRRLLNEKHIGECERSFRFPREV
jgi:hypothetical protein